MIDLFTWLFEPLTFEFMRNALLVGGILGVLCAVVGSYLIVKQMSMIGGVIAHAVIPGLSLALFLQVHLAIGAFLAGICSALVVAAIETRSRVKVDAAMALTLTTFLGVGVILISQLETNQIDLSSLLFGDILGVKRQDVWQAIIITSIVLILAKLFYKELLFYTFDPLGAKASGLPVNLLYFGLICAITLTIVASMQTVGVLLVMSLLVGPAITAYLLVKELHQMMWLGSIFGVISTLSGMYASYYLDVPSGAAIVTSIFLLFGLAFFLSPSQGILVKR
ncbi:metal ABC transporter permease [Spirulina sp. CS-785/01]|uniref:metal ABC transporter permease n=1 Tax=Spirulina sp. CS-785/01 TaxID=3021716 RepID=UPI00232AE507|nr:metal ABC transporter permease [Spirulina sp. CS-785/01]MDB9312476.1 metal ABC transporter permease [Spirulina sp. CS-785/01]